ncbi:hypothetical protein [Vibrio sp. WXL103]|uniref:hypothetical protein n=1 Tax=Vibrio sp. WXL103 TaxID=3450710 RepID=UPI003EC4F470
MNEKSNLDLSLDSQATAATPRIEMSTPNTILWECLLMVSTFGFYANFWLYFRIKELRKLTGRELRPALWFWVPFIAFAQIFALPRLNSILSQLENASSQQVKTGRFGYLVGSIGLILTTFYIAYSTAQLTSGVADAVAFGVFVGSFVLIAKRVRRLKLTSDRIALSPRHRRTVVMQRLLVIPMFPLITLLYLFGALAPMFEGRLETYPADTLYLSDDGAFQMPFHGGDWYRVENGTNSDGSALVEFVNDLPSSYLIVFDGDKFSGDELDNHLSERRDWVRSYLTKAACSQHRSFTPNSMELRLRLTCHGSKMFEPASVHIVLVQNESQSYEMIGFLNAPRGTYKEWLPAFEKIGKEFKTL